MSIRKFGAAVTTAALIASTLIVSGAPQAFALPQSIGGQGQVSVGPGRYIVTLVDPSAATYQGGVDGFAPTKPGDGKQLNADRRAVQSYSNYLADQQRNVAASVGARVDYSYTLAINGFATSLTARQAAALSANKNVAALTPDDLKHVTATPSTVFLGLEGPDGVWASIGGVGEAGGGVVVGMIDTGIAPENPSFAGAPLGTAPGAEPYLDGATITFARADGNTFTGSCVVGEQFTADDCSTKLVGARYYVDGFGATNIGTASTGEYLSPRDGNGHGSHTASTAGGNATVPASIGDVDFGTISGVAPAARIAAYKVCWDGPDPTVTSDDGCATSDILAAIDQAVADGVDVINYSIGGGAAQTTISPTDEAFLGAASAGVFVAASAGNDGPAASTLDNASPWITTVAAGTIPGYEATVTLGDGQAFAGASVTVDMDPDATPLNGNLVTASAVALPGAVKANLCFTGTLDPALAAGRIVVCERGENARVDKSAEVARAGGIGSILVNVVPGSLDLDQHAVPTIHLDARYHAAIMAYAATAGATATFTAGNATDYHPPTPQVAGFSSRGPVQADGSDILKPDITAPGVAIIADGANAAGGAPTFQFLSGTSMSAPHIAGLAALYLGERPNASPSEIKSAMMTTAYNTLDGDGNQVTDPFVQGAGHVDPTRYFSPGLLYLNGLDDWLSYIEGIGYEVSGNVDPIDPSNLNLASIAIGQLTAPETVTRTVTATQAGTFTASASIPGIDTVVSPSTLTFANAGDTATFTVTFSRTDAALDQFATGSLTWTSGDTVVRSPLAVQPVTIVAPDQVDGTGVSGSARVTVTPGGNADIPLATTGLTAGTLQPDPTRTETDHSGSGTTGDEFQYKVTVPAGAQLARFDLDSVDNAADLDLIVYLLDARGTPIAGWQSASGSADERIDLVAPTAGKYLVIVSVFSAVPPTAFDLTTVSVLPDGAPLTLDPAVLAGQQGVPATFMASWTSLKPFTTYLGLVRYGATGASTVVSVKTGAPLAPVSTAPPTITGTPEVGKSLTAKPGEWDVDGLTFSYQWQAGGVDIPGATHSRYRVGSSDQGAALTVVVTASKKGLPNGTAASAAVTVKYNSTTDLVLSQRVASSGQLVVAEVTVTTAADEPPTGTVNISVNESQIAELPLVASDGGTLSYTLPTLSPGVYRVQATFVSDSDALVGSESARRMLKVVT